MNSKKLVIAVWLFSLTPFAHCQAQYRQHNHALLNDLTITPGATLPQDTKDVLCSPSFHTGTVRAVSEATKQQACREYGIDRAHCTGTLYEIDHLISLELGGSDDIKNLWPQPYSPTPGAHEKDKVENWLHRQVCSGNTTLTSAQDAIAQDWYTVYLRMPNAAKTKTAKTSQAKSSRVPARATGRCSDGTYTFIHRGACSRHGGVSQWF